VLATVFHMPSPALINWNTSAVETLSQLEAAHRAVGGTRAGRRTNTLQLNYAFVLLLSAHFQAYCRSLHSQAISRIAAALSPGFGEVISANLTFQRQLDSRNAQPGSIGADFNRLGLRFWNAVEAVDTRNAGRRGKLDRLNDWRNAIAHHDVASRRPSLVPHEVTLDACGSWRSALDGLARSFDIAVAEHLAALIGSQPW
jgi:hypothetical protein